MTERDDLTARLRALPVFSGELPKFDPTAAPADPVALFTDWIGEAIDARVREPHAMSLSTVDASGAPNVRVLILKGVVADGAWRFAGSRETAKGSELTARPEAAAAFYWPALGRQIRLRGLIREAGAEESLADYLARSPSARAQVSQSVWTLWELVAGEIEFFQGDVDRDHQRLVYHRTTDGWNREQLSAKRVFGLDRGLLAVPEDFDAPLPKALQDAFER